MDTGSIKCPACSAPLKPGAKFCAACGKPLSAAPKSETPTPAAPKFETPKQETPKQQTPTSGGSGCPFELSAALPKAMQVSRRSQVFVYFRTTTDIYEKVELVLRNGTEELARKDCCHGRPLAGRQYDIALDVVPKHHGTAQVELDVYCCFGSEEGDREQYTAPLNLQVRQQQNSSASFNPVFNVHDIKADKSGDASAGNFLFNLGDFNKREDVDESQYTTDPSERRPLAPALRNSPTRLTLAGGEEVLQLLSDHEVTFGRNSSTTIPLRVCGADGRVNDVASNLSRVHFRIANDNRACRLSDGGYCDGELKPSTNGTRLEGEQLPPNGSARLVPGRTLRLSAGSVERELRMKLKVFADSWERPCGFVLDRLDGARQRTCAVWREVQLDDRDRVFWNGCSWSLMSDDGLSRSLSVGTKVQINGREYAVLPFRKTHLN